MRSKKQKNARMAKAGSESGRGGLPVYDSLGHCSGRLGIPLPILQRLKRQGSPAFIGSRVYLCELLPDLAMLSVSPAPEKLNAREAAFLKKMDSQNRRLERQLEIEDRQYVSILKVIRWEKECREQVLRVVGRIRKLAPKFAGLTIPQAEALLLEWQSETITALGLPMDECEAWLREKERAQ